MLEAFPAASLVDVHLETGRTHQIRVHLSALRHPCVGDLTYGADPTLAARLGVVPAVAARRLARLRAPRRRALGGVHQRVPARPGRRAGRPARGILTAVGLPVSLTAFGPAALAAVVAAAYLVVGEPIAGAVLHRRFEGRLRADPGARRSFYRRLLVLEWGLTVVVAVVMTAAPGVGAAGLGLQLPQQAPGCSLRRGRGGRRAGGSCPPGRCCPARWVNGPAPVRREGEGRHTEPPVHATLALLPRTRTERRLFTRGRRSRRASARSGCTAASSSPWCPRVAGGPADRRPRGGAGVAFGLAHAYQGVAGVVTTGVLGAVLAALYLGHRLAAAAGRAARADRPALPVVPARMLPAGSRLAS